MDADTRHQLKTNELAEFLSKLRNLKDPKYLYTLVALAVVVIVVVAWYAQQYSQRRALEQDSQRLTKAVAALATDDKIKMAGAQDEMRAIIREVSNPGLAGYARLQLARSRYEQALNEPDSRQAALEDAETLLLEIKSGPQTPAMLDAAASYLLANTYESKREIDKARELWESLAHEARYNGTAYMDLASDRLSSIDALTVRVAFEPGDPPAPKPPASPSMQPGKPVIRKLSPEEAAPLDAARRRAEEAEARQEPAPEATETKTTPPEAAPEQPESDAPEPTSQPSS